MLVFVFVVLFCFARNLPVWLGLPGSELQGPTVVPWLFIGFRELNSQLHSYCNKDFADKVLSPVCPFPGQYRRFLTTLG